jgi:hypothetical protein
MGGDVNRYVYRRGNGALRRVMHLAGYDRLGRFSGVLCGLRLGFDTSCNLPLGRPVCKRCQKIERELAA